MKNINDIINEKYNIPQQRLNSKSPALNSYIYGVSNILKSYKLLLKHSYRMDFINDAKKLYSYICEYMDELNGEYTVGRMLEEIDDKQINKVLELDSDGEYKYSTDVWKKALKKYLGI